MNNSIQFLGLAKKAGCLVIGEESVFSAARMKKARVILSARDSSERSRQRAESAAGTGGVPWVTLPYEKWELGAVLGRGTPGTLALCDIGMAAAFMEKLSREEGGAYEEQACLLSEKNRRIISRKKRTRAGEKARQTGRPASSGPESRAGTDDLPVERNGLI